MTSHDVPSKLDSPSGAPTRGAGDAARRERTLQRDDPDLPPRSRSPHDDDRTLIARLLNRDAAAWAEFLSRFERLIASRVIATCRELDVEPLPDLVEECGAEVMAALFHHDLSGLRRFEGRSKLSTWLAVVARRTTLGIVHKRLRDVDTFPRPDSRFDIGTIPDANASTPSPADAEDRELLQAAMRQLSTGDRQILQLQFEQQLSYAAIGRILGISENAVGPKLHRAQKRLKKLMSKRALE